MWGGEVMVMGGWGDIIQNKRKHKKRQAASAIRSMVVYSRPERLSSGRRTLAQRSSTTSRTSQMLMSLTLRSSTGSTAKVEHTGPTRPGECARHGRISCWTAVGTGCSTHSTSVSLSATATAIGTLSTVHRRLGVAMIGRSCRHGRQPRVGPGPAVASSSATTLASSTLTAIISSTGWMLLVCS